jgi:hypothetical protein
LKLERALLRQLLQNIFGHESWNNELREKLISFVFYGFEMDRFYGGMLTERL